MINGLPVLDASHTVTIAVHIFKENISIESLTNVMDLVFILEDHLT